jgi:patatin-like phospholipase/acyl hydrolase
MKKILSIDSGGIRGIIPAIILAEIEARAGQPVCNLFDFFAGTSTGGMLVLSLNCPDPSLRGWPLCSGTEVAQLFHEWGNRVFGRKLAKADQLLSEKRSEDRIEEMFREYFGNTLLSDSIKPTLVTAFDLAAGQPFFFNSAKTVRKIGTDVFMWQAARATTAVPTHFAPLRLAASRSPFSHSREVRLVDGSLFASNPAMCALAEAHALFPNEDDFLVISLGCGETANVSLPVNAVQKRRRIIDFSLTAQSDCVDYQMRTLLSGQRYVRIQTDLAPGLDRIDNASKENLLFMERTTRETIVRCNEVLDRVVDLLAPSATESLELAVA